MPIDDPNSNILFFSKLNEPIRWISKNFKIHFVFSIDAHDIFLGNLRPKVFQNVLFRCYMLMVHFQPFFGFLIITQQFDQDLKKKVGHCYVKLAILYNGREAPLNFSSLLWRLCSTKGNFPIISLLWNTFHRIEDFTQINIICQLCVRVCQQHRRKMWYLLSFHLFTAYRVS